MDDLILLKKNIPLLQYNEREYECEVTKVFNIQHIMPHLFLNGRPDATNIYALGQKLFDFINERIIPYNRKNFKELLGELGLSSAEELSRKSFYLSLSDQYWVCPAKDFGKIWWEDINFFSNEYDSAIGLRLVSSSKPLDRTSLSQTPDSTTGGELPKRWFRKDGINYLEKAGTGTEQQECINEVTASEICRRLGISHIPYELCVRDNAYYCVCPDIVTQSEEMVPMASLYQDLHLTPDGRYDYEALINRCKELEIPNAEEDLLKILLLDFIIANEDRHAYNISFLRNSDTLEWLGLSPVYDSGKSLFVNKVGFEVEQASSASIPAKPFESTQIRQFNALPFEKLCGKVDMSALEDFPVWYADFLSPLRRIPQEKKEALLSAVKRRINEATCLLKEKSLIPEASLEVNAPESDYFARKLSKAERTVERVYSALCTDCTQTKEDLSLRLGISRATVTRALQTLVSSGRIKRRGSNKTGSWTLTG